MECYNKWNTDDEAITAVIITVASLVSSKFETAFRQFASQFSTRMLGKNDGSGEIQGRIDSLGTCFARQRCRSNGNSVERVQPKRVGDGIAV